MDAYIVAGFRTGVGKAKKGGFRFVRPDDLAADVIKHLVKSVPGLENSMIDDLIVGNAVPEAEQGMQMGRMISLLALGIDTPGMIVNRYCGSGVETIAMHHSAFKPIWPTSLLLAERNLCRWFQQWALRHRSIIKLLPRTQRITPAWV